MCREVSLESEKACEQKTTSKINNQNMCSFCMSKIITCMLKIVLQFDSVLFIIYLC